MPGGDPQECWPASHRGQPADASSVAHWSLWPKARRERTRAARASARFGRLVSRSCHSASVACRLSRAASYIANSLGGLVVTLAQRAEGRRGGQQRPDSSGTRTAASVRGPDRVLGRVKTPGRKNSCGRRHVVLCVRQINEAHVAGPGLAVVEVAAADDETAQATRSFLWTGVAARR
ncbi:DUF6207 family protein [Streptomyces purpurascens]|uniref:DUF6207 family protein n=1 Tax=Streptomyces purpurascens TaxID=1924 RepID=UPI0033DB35E1